MTILKDGPLRKSMSLSVKLGNPKYKCARYGICEINPDDDCSCSGTRVQLMDKRVRATVFTTQQQQLLFFFDRKSLTAQTDKTYFGNDFFIIEVAKELPLAVSNKLGIKPCQIESGMYSISRHQDFYKIVMDIKSITGFKQPDCGCSSKQINTRIRAF